jgi:hypothetical protein
LNSTEYIFFFLYFKKYNGKLAGRPLPTLNPWVELQIYVFVKLIFFFFLKLNEYALGQKGYYIPKSNRKKKSNPHHKRKKLTKQFMLFQEKLILHNWTTIYPPLISFPYTFSLSNNRRTSNIIYASISNRSFSFIYYSLFIYLFVISLQSLITTNSLIINYKIK